MTRDSAPGPRYGQSPQTPHYRLALPRSSYPTNHDLAPNIFPVGPPMLSDSPTILIFPHQTGCQYSDEYRAWGRRMKWGYEKITIFDQYLALSGK